MSKKGDFLSRFSGGDTQKPLPEQSEEPITQVKSADKSKTEVKTGGGDNDHIARNKKLADQIVTESERTADMRVRTSTRSEQRENAIIKAPEHTITKDEEFHKRKMVKYGLIGTISTVTIVVIFFLVRILTSVELMNFTGDEIDDARTWGVMNRITIETQEEYSLEFAEGQITNQSHDPGTNLSRNSVLTLTVSLGPDMNEVITLPDFEEMTGAQIRSWRLDNQMMAVTVREEASDEIETNQFIRMEVPNDVDVDDFIRSDSLVIYVSSGPETVQMGNFMTTPNNTREGVEAWIAENPSITVKFVYETSETVDHDTVLRQSAAPNSILDAGATVTVTLSGGLPIIVPNFADIPRDEAVEAGLEIGLIVNKRTRFNGFVPYGHIVAQSVEPGYELFGEDASITVTYSLWFPWIDELSMENDIQTALFEFNSQGAWITYDIVRVDSGERRGSIVHQSLYNQFLALDAHIIFHVSRGNLASSAPLEPDFPDDEPDLGPEDGID